MTDSNDDQASQDETARDEAKRRFREALDRKQRRNNDPLSHDPVVAHPHTAPAKPQRTFRRKSG